jgi:hypothetical protein
MMTKKKIKKKKKNKKEMMVNSERGSKIKMKKMVKKLHRLLDFGEIWRK